jgi:hypothetical protein
VTSDVEPKEEKEEREIELQIRLVNGDKFTIVAHIEDLVWDVKQKITAQQGYTNKQLKLIHQGRVLLDPHSLHQSRITQHTILHCAVSEAPDTAAALPAHPAHDEQVLRGFDRLRAMGLSAEEVAAVRTQFSASQSVQTQLGARPSPELLTQLEENWIEHELTPEDRQVAAAHAIEHTQREGSGAQLFGGMLSGFVLGLLAVYWLWDSSVTRQGKFGLLTGLALNLMFGLIRLSSL